MRLTSRRALRIFDLADLWATRTGHEVRLVSANDHTHSRKSAHYIGRAVDFISSSPDQLAAFFRRLGYRVLWRVPGHYGHVHVQEEGTAAASSGTGGMAPPSSRPIGKDEGHALPRTGAAAPSGR